MLKNKAYKVCSDNESMCFFQKLIGDHYRYAYDALDINPYVQPPLTQQVTNDDGTVEEVIIPTDNALTAGLGA